jgi:flavodoxin
VKAVVVYDSVFGNTAEIARAMGEAISSEVEAETLQVDAVKPDRLTLAELVIVGSPTRGFRPTEATTALLKSIPRNGLRGIKVAAFDTRIDVHDIESSTLRFVVKTGGYAAKPIADSMKKKGGDLIVAPGGFYVNDTEGPLRSGELERAAEWARHVLEAANHGEQ